MKYLPMSFFRLTHLRKLEREFEVAHDLLQKVLWQVRVGPALNLLLRRMLKATGGTQFHQLAFLLSLQPPTPEELPDNIFARKVFRVFQELQESLRRELALVDLKSLAILSQARSIIYDDIAGDYNVEKLDLAIRWLVTRPSVVTGDLLVTALAAWQEEAEKHNVFPSLLERLEELRIELEIHCLHYYSGGA